MTSHADLIARLRNCNPPDRTIDEQRPVAELIVEAAAALESQAAEITRLQIKLEESVRGKLEELERAEQERDSWAFHGVIVP